MLADLGHSAAAARIAAAFAERATLLDADTVNRELSVLRAAVGWLTAAPTAGLERRPAPPDRTRALTHDQIAALFELKAGLREKTLWRLLYESCARAEEILTLDVGDNKRGRVISGLEQQPTDQSR
ncbi:hypothetical protein ABZV14_35845 [Streptosporangium canum]|uniref:hypothetical protein n=1 Tax=Streptosporangium canum TaxID=324952 RepID=UPI0033A2D2D7